MHVTCQVIFLATAECQEFVTKAQKAAVTSFVKLLMYVSPEQG